MVQCIISLYLQTRVLHIHYLCTLSIVYNNSSSVHARIPFNSRLSWGLDTNYSLVLESISTTCPMVS
jgi:hypothetical protein